MDEIKESLDAIKDYLSDMCMYLEGIETTLNRIADTQDEIQAGVTDV